MEVSEGEESQTGRQRQTVPAAGTEPRAQDKQLSRTESPTTGNVNRHNVHANSRLLSSKLPPLFTLTFS